LLFAAFLMPHVEDVLQLRMRAQHVPVKMLDDVVTVLGQYRCGCFHDVLGLLRQHCRSPFRWRNAFWIASCRTGSMLGKADDATMGYGRAIGLD
jgi:hypothetical protein